MSGCFSWPAIFSWDKLFTSACKNVVAIHYAGHIPAKGAVEFGLNSYECMILICPTGGGEHDNSLAAWHYLSIDTLKRSSNLLHNTEYPLSTKLNTFPHCLSYVRGVPVVPR